MALTTSPEFDRERFISEVYRAELDAGEESDEYIAWREVELIPSNFFLHYKFVLFSSPRLRMKNYGVYISRSKKKCSTTTSHYS